MIYQVGKKQCSNSGRKRNDIDPLESDFMVQPPSLLEFPGPLTPPTPLEFPIPSVVGVWIFSGTTQYGFRSSYSATYSVSNFNIKVKSLGILFRKFSKCPSCRFEYFLLR